MFYKLDIQYNIEFYYLHTKKALLNLFVKILYQNNIETKYILGYINGDIAMQRARP
jgi:hypothetical protein